ncbi:MAG TPA: hypothetical protein DCM05_05875 [Elusimicrobia bacterium]|nr:hypothetical protein [Elusimicrobiota bacterium]
MPRKASRKPPVKKKVKAVVRKKAAPKRPVKSQALKRSKKLLTLRPGETLKPKEVEALLNQLQSEERSEKAWLEMTAIKPSAEEDRWNEVEESLVSGKQDAKQWKHFAK